MAEGKTRPAWVEVDVDALAHNASVMQQIAAPAKLCAVVKADAYGHGALRAARAFLEGGARWLAVAIADEGAELRERGIEAPILVLAEPHEDAIDLVIDYRLTPTVVYEGFVAALGKRAIERQTTVSVHPKVDTGMHRVGRLPSGLGTLLACIDDTDGVTLGGIWTHFADADNLSSDGATFTNQQIEAFRQATKDVDPRVLRHAANSAGTLSNRESHFDMVRCGISLYGVLPHKDFGALLSTDGKPIDLHPALSLHARITQVQRLDAGARPSYGRHRALRTSSFVATVPVGYADGVPRRLFFEAVPVLIGGKRRPLAGMVTMDQIVVDCGDDDVSIGDKVTLLGTQGGETIDVEDWAEALGTISYEVLCALGARLPRVVKEAL